MDDEETILVPGYKLDRYELLCPIASGGMATVWLARMRGKRGFEKLFAIKVIKTEHLSDPRFQAMFLDEARLASAIEHPNVAQILDLGEQEAVLYTVMEWVDGESLAKIHRRAEKRGQRLPLGVALRIVADACAGLHAAHELRDGDDKLGVVHRDVSPQNILVTTGGTVKVIDFGVAKAKGRIAGDTKSGVVKGKIRYMAPEQVRGLPIDQRADLWSLGMCLLELVSGKAPFDEHSDVEVLRLLMSENPIPKLEGVPDAVAPILAHTIARDPAERFASGSAMRRAIEAIIDEHDFDATNEDVAEFLKTHLPELAQKRRTTVTKAIDAAKARGDGRADAGARVSVPPPEDEAFAATIASDDALPLSRRKTKLEIRRQEVARQVDDSRTTGGATLSEQLEERPRSRVGTMLFAVVGVAAALWVVWPKSAPRDAPTPAASTSAMPLPAVTQLPSASASVTAEPPSETFEIPDEPAPSIPRRVLQPVHPPTAETLEPLPRADAGPRVLPAWAVPTGPFAPTPPQPQEEP